MQYAEIREKIKTGDVLAWSHGSWASIYDAKINVVRIATRSTYSHVGIAWVVGGRVFCVEAVTPLVRIYPLSKLGNFYWIPIKQELSGKATEFMLSKVGHPYSQWQAIKAFFGHLAIGQDSLWECAELVNTTLSHDYPVFSNYKATPADTVTCCQSDLDLPLFYVEQD